MPSSPSPRIVHLATVSSEDGDLTYIDRANMLPFAIARVYYIYRIPANATRGGHAHKRCSELLIALNGAYTVGLEAQNGEASEFRLDEPTSALFVPPLYWRTLYRFTEDAQCLVLASEGYDAEEYLRDYDEFRRFRTRRDGDPVS